MHCSRKRIGLRVGMALGHQQRQQVIRARHQGLAGGRGAHGGHALVRIQQSGAQLRVQLHA